MKHRYIVGLLLCVGSLSRGLAQGIHAHHETASDTNTLGHFLERGRFYGHARSFHSFTLNQQSLSDYYAWGVGAGIGYETPKFWKRWQVGLSGFFMFNVLSSDLAKVDPNTKQLNRYEIGLFDIERPSDHEDLDRLEELFVKTHLGKHSVLTVGRQIPQSPFVNPQDGRMRPTLSEAASLQFREWKNWQLQVEYIWRVSPRSTVRWFDVSESVGIYPSGVDINGKPSQYAQHIFSEGILVAGLSTQLRQWSVQYWNTAFLNVLNTSFAKAEWKSKPKQSQTWLLGMQLLVQHRLGQGGNPDPSLAYAQSAGTQVASGRVGRQTPRFDWYLNATRITGKGRYLMPREWGREPFYTFLPRERNEGMGDVTALSINAFFKPNKQLKVELSAGYYRLPDVRNALLNKYGMPSYSQVNLGLSYHFGHFLKGLNALLLVVRKDELGETYQNDRYVFNKVNMTHLNFILNYHY